MFEKPINLECLSFVGMHVFHINSIFESAKICEPGTPPKGLRKSK